jgi:hypothetical protein
MYNGFNEMSLDSLRETFLLIMYVKKTKSYQSTRYNIGFFRGIFLEMHCRILKSNYVKWGHIWNRCYDFQNILAENLAEKVFLPKYYSSGLCKTVLFA